MTDYYTSLRGGAQRRQPALSGAEGWQSTGQLGEKCKKNLTDIAADIAV